MWQRSKHHYSSFSDRQGATMNSAMSTFRIAAIAVACFGATASFGAVNLVTNGSFETGSNAPAAGNFYYRTLSPGALDITGWTVFGDSIGWYNQNHPYLLSVPLGASNGIMFVDLTDQTAGVPYGGLYTNIATTVGTKYTLTFDLGTSKFFNPANGASAALTIGNLPFAFFTSVTTQASAWETKTLTFTAAVANTQLGFLGWSGKDFIGIDNVSVMAAVPEPSAIALMLAGLGIIGSVAARRRPQR
jgi:Protein of unknown function (DUF642)/PEP-CTERM motif